jgi:hypothetical protein
MFRRRIWRNKQRWRDDAWSRCAIFRRPTKNAMLTLSIWSTIRRLMRYARSQHLRASQERCGYRTQSKSAVERANFGKQKYPGAQLGQTWASLRRPRWYRLRFRSRPLRLCQLPSPPQLQLFHRFLHPLFHPNASSPLSAPAFSGRSVFEEVGASASTPHLVIPNVVRICFLAIFSRIS